MNTPYAPNAEGATQCVVRWMVDTPAGWLGAYDKAAFDAYATQARADLVAAIERKDALLRQALEALDAAGKYVQDASVTAAITKELSQ